MKQVKVSELPSGNSKTDNVHGGKPELDPRKHKKMMIILLVFIFAKALLLKYKSYIKFLDYFQILDFFPYVLFL
jgi:hypothetical protein